MVYTWLCLKCEEETTVVRKMDYCGEGPHYDCECGGSKLTKVLTSSPIHGSNKGNIHSGS